MWKWTPDHSCMFAAVTIKNHRRVKTCQTDNGMMKATQLQHTNTTIQIKLRWALFVTHNYTEYNEWNVFSAFNPSKCTHLEQWAADCAAPGEQSWTSCRRGPQPWVTSCFKSNALSTRPRLLGVLDTEDWSNDVENSSLITGINDILKYIQIESSYFK